MEQPPGLAKPSRTESTAENTSGQDLSARQPHELRQSSLTTKAFTRGEWVEDLLAGLAAYYLTTLPVLVGVLFGAEFFHLPGGDASVPVRNPMVACIRFDAIEYLEIIRRGYSYDPNEKSLVAYFPAYPLLSRRVCLATGLLPADAALVVTHTALLVTFVLLARYVRTRWPEALAGQRGLVLAFFGLWPLGLFFRIPYAESLFVCGVVAVLYGMTRGWPLAFLAVLTGFVTAVRPVGVALTAAFVWYVLTRPRIRTWVKSGQVLLLAPLASWGLLAYMAYQWMAFGTPWAFAQTQEHWHFLTPQDRSWQAKFWSLATLEPIWGVYMPTYPRYWGNVRVESNPLFNMIFWNPILFALAAVLLLVGGWKRWLTGSELVLGAGLLAIPYLTRSYEMSMVSHGRFAAVVVVNYLVLARLLVRLPSLAVATVCAALALFLCLFTALYAANHLVF